LAATAFVAPFLTRLVMGQAFFQTGRGKIENFSNTVAFFTELGIPMPELNAAFVSRLEYYGGLALLLGLGTRIVAALLSSTMVVALLTADKPAFVAALAGTGDGGLTDVTPFVYLLRACSASAGRRRSKRTRRSQPTRRARPPEAAAGQRGAESIR
jgi:uncharacterized membrane protein YphA (DoxX/SURF4 family)